MTDEEETTSSENEVTDNSETLKSLTAESNISGPIEALLFSSPDPLPSEKISAALNKIGVARVKKAIAALNETYETNDSAFRIRQVGGGYQFYILPQFASYVNTFFSRPRKLRLTKAALETLAIVAYKQPVSKNQVEYIRGVASDGVIGNLLEKELIHISGRSEGVGRSLLYSATEEFLKFFGLNSFDDLPRITEIEEMIQQMESERSDNAEDLFADNPADSPADNPEESDQTEETKTADLTEDDSNTDTASEVKADSEAKAESEEQTQDKPATELA